LRILMIIQGSYGQRMVDNIRKHAPPDWNVEHIVLQTNLPAIIDDSDEYLPEKLPESDLLISLGEEQGVAQMIPDIVEKSGAKAVIAPADNRVWLPAGLARQIKQKLEKKGVEMVYPVPFCMLSEKSSENTYIREFARYFGRPDVDIELDNEYVLKLTVKRDAPCGSTGYVAEHLPGTRIGEAVEQAGLMHHQYPCLATMGIDKEFEDTLMHRAGLAVKQTVESAIKENKKK
jgi:thymidylate synthase